MTFVDISGNISVLDDVLKLCLASGFFHPENSAKLSEYSIGIPAFGRNPYGGLIVKINDIASQLNIKLSYREYGSGHINRDEFINASHEYLNGIRKTYPQLFERRRKIRDEIASYTTALEMLSHVNVSDINFDNIWSNEFLKIRFGRLPAENMQKLEAYGENPFELYVLDKNPQHVWCLYFTADEYRDEVDKLFFSLGFERLRVPDYVKGTSAEAIGAINQSLVEERSVLQESIDEIADFVNSEQEGFLRAYSHIKFLHDAYDLRRYTVSIRDRFHLVGFVLKKEKNSFLSLFENMELEIAADDNAANDRLPVPVKLRNNWFVRPFEMFVKLYGSPSYKDIDPSPFLAYTYTILFGIMFGDVGQGLCVVLLGWFLWAKKKMELGLIMTRIGCASAFVGFWYGSVFGFEHLLDPFFINVMGLAGKPIEVLHPDTTSKILIAAVGLGALSIISAILFNVLIGFKQKNFDRMLLSSNGLCGLVFYSAILAGAVLTILGNNVFTPLYIILLIVLPLLLIFFREPIARYAHFINNDTLISHDVDLQTGNLLTSGTSIPELFSSPFMTARFGRIPTDSYQKLSFYTHEPFMLYPVKTDPEYIWLIYATPLPNKEEVDAIFHDLYFERIYIPDEELKTEQEAVDFIKKCIEHGTPQDTTGKKFAPVAAAKPKSVYRQMFPDGFGNFFTETFFEMFEVILSFISNTMSFLRVGGFILVHVGMMSVVFTLAQMVNAGASVFIIIIGNAFVMVMEGLIVGIQVLRLEFYELFSRFYGNYGDAFAPVKMEYPA